MISALCLSLAIQVRKPAQLELRYDDQLDQSIIAYNLDPKKIELKWNQSFALVKGKKSVSASQILDLGAGYIAPWWFHLGKSDSKEKWAIKEWLQTHLKDLSPGAEREALDFMIFRQDVATEPTIFSEKAIQKSSVVAMATMMMWGPRLLPTDESLRLMKLAKESVLQVPIFKNFPDEMEGGYQFHYYLLKKDPKALKLAIDHWYKAAAMDPRPGAMDHMKKFCKRWEKILAKAEGGG